MKNISDAQKNVKIECVLCFSISATAGDAVLEAKLRSQCFSQELFRIHKRTIDWYFVGFMLFIDQLCSTAQPVEGMSRRSNPEKKISPASDISNSSYSCARISEVVRTMSAAHSEWLSFTFFGFPVLLSLRVWSPCIVMICTTRY